MKPLLFGLLALAGLSGAQSQQTFAGTITDDMCAMADHAGMQMGPTDADCTRACVDAHGAQFVLFDGRTVYSLSDQKAPAELAGRKVRVTGTLDAATRTIAVRSIAAAE